MWAKTTVSWAVVLYKCSKNVAILTEEFSESISEWVKLIAFTAVLASFIMNHASWLAFASFVRFSSLGSKQCGILDSRGILN
jgi:hypothetical protein